ncbi:hypothetical protein LC1Hm_0912 [Halomicrobium sp. LC1Hm]|nr:hypothetical protein LC1Hm_0912 [Halomicrobium sp. LC1Hm]
MNTQTMAQALARRLDYQIHTLHGTTMDAPHLTRYESDSVLTLQLISTAVPEAVYV